MHTHARHPVLEFVVPADTFIRTIELELADDMIGVFLTAGAPRLLIWNWKEGYLISVGVLRGKTQRRLQKVGFFRWRPPPTGVHL